MDTLHEWMLSTIVVETIMVCAFRLTNNYIKRKEEESIVNTIIEYAFNSVIGISCIHIITMILNSLLDSLN